MFKCIRVIGLYTNRLFVCRVFFFVAAAKAAAEAAEAKAAAEAAAKKEAEDKKAHRLAIKLARSQFAKAAKGAGLPEDQVETLRNSLALEDFQVKQNNDDEKESFVKFENPVNR